MRLVLASVFALAPFAALAATQITPISDVQRGSSVTIQGTVERILDSDEFRIADATGNLRVYVGPNVVPANVGETVTVSGIMDDEIIRPELYAREVVRADGTTVRLNRSYY
ncbi:hypothetical protein AADZ90_013780 [Aestuariibius sp. 2305UL40-4]|uniref:hypothetical protein n=1 Tax=Aestuariibius violaceus TaxID=3234132 RepID=UPI00345EF92D